MNGRTAPSSDGLLVEVLGFSSAVRQMPADLCTAPRIILLSPLSLATDVTDATLGTSGQEPGQELVAPSHKLKVFFGRSPWLHGQVYSRTSLRFAVILFISRFTSVQSSEYRIKKWRNSTTTSRSDSDQHLQDSGCHLSVYQEIGAVWKIVLLIHFH